MATPYFDSGPIAITHLHAISPELPDNAAWREWSRTPSPLSLTGKITPTTLSPALKRRSNHLTRLALEVSNLTLAESPEVPSYILFGSRHGDVHCASELLIDIARKEPLSPTRFVQSVHNAPAGVFSLANNLTQNVSAIAAGDNTLSMAFVLACTHLASQPASPVMITVADDTLPEAYLNLADTHATPAFGFSLLLQRANKTTPAYRLQLSHAQTHSDAPPPFCAPLAFLAWYFQEASSPLVYASENTIAHWERGK